MKIQVKIDADEVQRVIADHINKRLSAIDLQITVTAKEINLSDLDTDGALTIDITRE
jgi:hypothetical protein